jgi:hypothetical protein
MGGELVQQRSVVISGTTLEGANRNRPVITRQVITYRLSKRIPGAPTTYEIAFNAPFSDNGELFAPIQVISPDMGLALFDGLTPVANIADDFVDLTVELEFRGEYNATRTPFTTGVATLPIRVYRSDAAACAGGYQRFPFDPATQTIDACWYMGQSTYQVFQPGKPVCCDPATNPNKLGC